MKVKSKKISTPRSPKAQAPVTMHPKRHRTMLTQVDAARCIFHNLANDLKVLYGTDVVLKKLFGQENSASEVYYAMLSCETHCKKLMELIEAHAAKEHPGGIPDTV